MMHLSFLTFAFAILLPCINARTDLTGCTRTDISSPAGASYAWIVPGTGELCEFLDCGGGRAPPRINVPGCAAYTGTQAYEPSYMAGFTAGGAVSTAMSTITAEVSTTASVTYAITPTATAGVDDGDVDETGDGDDVEAQESASVIAPIISAATTTASTGDATATVVGSSDYQGSTTIWSSTDLSIPTSTSQALTSSSIIGSTSSGTTYSTTTDTTFTSALSSTVGTTTATGNLSMSRSWVKTIPTFTRADADDEIVRAGVTKSASASLVVSTGAAGRVGVAGSAGVVAVVVGVLVVM
jgi:hypothetical protein